MVRLNVRAKGVELLSGNDAGVDHAHEDIYVAIRDSFDAMRRRLEDHARRRRGHVKYHEETPHGRIAEIDLSDGFGRIETNEGCLVYFCGNSVADADFAKLAPGTEVRFAEEAGKQRPQAIAVRVISHG